MKIAESNWRWVGEFEKKGGGGSKEGFRWEANEFWIGWVAQLLEAGGLEVSVLSKLVSTMRGGNPSYGGLNMVRERKIGEEGRGSNGLPISNPLISYL